MNDDLAMLYGDARGGFGGNADVNEMYELQKALGTGGALTGGFPSGTGAPLRVESLEGTLKTTTFRMEHIKFWRAIPKKRAYNTAEEFNVLDSYGADSSAFFEEGGLPDEEDSNYRREVGIVKFLGNTRVVTHPMTLVRAAHGDVIARETIAGTMWILKMLNYALYFGDDTLNPLSFKGLKQQVVNGVGGYGAEQIIDCRGNPLDEEYLELGGQITADWWSQMHVLFADTRTLSDVAKQFYPKERIQMPAPMNGIAGTPITHFASQNGVVRLEPDVFLKPKNAPPKTAGKYAPSTATTAMGAITTVASLHTSATYYYFITSVGIKGTESAPYTVIHGAATFSPTGATQAVRIRIPQITTGAYTKNPRAYSYNIYRGTTSDPNKAGYIGSVADPRNFSPGSTTYAEFIDYNYDLPGTATAFGLYMDGDQGLAFKQLAPLMKIDLATISAAIRWMVLLYGMLQVYAPTKMIIYKNIGRLPKK